MATYKVLQDIEAEDKLFGPFTLKQFIFGGITIGIAFIGFQILVVEAPIFLKVPFIAVLVPFFLLFGFLAAPITRDQASDVWLIARLKFLFNPRKRIWNQDGIVELVTVTAPKKVEHVYTNNFTQEEVRSRLSALANTVDSRGWAVKNVNANMYTAPGYLASTSSDRLIDPSSIPHEVPSVDVTASDDMLDPQNNTTAQHLDQMIQQSANSYRQQITSTVNPSVGAQPTSPTPAAYWSPPGAGQQPAAQTSVADQQLANTLRDSRASASTATSQMKTIDPSGVTQKPVQQATAGQQDVNPAIINLANNDDLSISTIARQASKINKPEDDGEVVVSLH